MAAIVAHNVTFVTGSELLDDVARDLACAISGPLPCSIEVHLGMHAQARLKPFVPQGRRDLVIGLQTEQLLDESGQPLWRNRLSGKVLAGVPRYDHVIDLSQANAPVYSALPPDLRDRIIIGPYIFPASAPACNSPAAGPFVFFGAPNARREAVLADLARHGLALRRLPSGTFGPELASEIAAAAAIVNIHFDQGRYTEYPRLLKAVLAGKPLLSEPLAAPLASGTHYLPTDRGQPDPGSLIAAYDAMVALLCTDYALHPVLDRLCTARKAVPA